MPADPTDQGEAGRAAGSRSPLRGSAPPVLAPDSDPEASLGRPIPTFETTLATGSVFAPPTFVQIQIPELNVTSVKTTVSVPVFWEEEEDE